MLGIEYSAECEAMERWPQRPPAADSAQRRDEKDPGIYTFAAIHPHG